MQLKGRNFLKLMDYTPEEITYLIDLSQELKEKKKKGIRHDELTSLIHTITVRPYTGRSQALLHRHPAPVPWQSPLWICPVCAFPESSRYCSDLLLQSPP